MGAEEHSLNSMKNLEKIELKIVREYIGGGIYICHSDCSFFQQDKSVNFTECILTGEILDMKKHKGRYVSGCSYKVEDILDNKPFLE